MKKQPTKVSDIIKKLVGSIEERQPFSEDEVLCKWGQIVGDAAQRHTQPSSIRRGVLRITVDNPGWIQELTIKKRRILRRLQSHFGKDKISEIRFRSGTIKIKV